MMAIPAGSSRKNSPPYSARPSGAPACRLDFCAILAFMDIANILKELRQEHAQLTEVILSIERMAAGQGKRSSGSVAWMDSSGTDAPARKRGRPPGSKNAPRKQD